MGFDNTPQLQEVGRWVIISGVAIAIVGFLLYLIGYIPFLKNLGRLPGDVLIQKENVSFYFPIATSLLFSIALSLVLWLLRR